MYFIGVDLGTSAVKLVLTDEKGKICNIVSKEYPIEFPHPGWSEQNPADWYEKTVEGLKELTKDIDGGDVCGIGFGGQMHGLVILDENDDVIRPAILWNDSRTAEQSRYLNENIGKDTLSSFTGNISFAGFTAPKFLWLKENEPENFGRIRKWMLPKDYMVYKMSGTYCTDYSDASGTLLLDVKNRCWSSEMMKMCGIDNIEAPELFESYEKAGVLKESFAKELGFGTNVVIAAGAGDNAAAAVGTGTVGEGRCNISLGTSGTLFITSEKFRVDDDNCLHAFAHADGRYHMMGCMLSAASCNMWWSDQILETSDYAHEQEKIKTLGENHVYYLPYLMGERSPWNDPFARGTFTGMTMDTKREDMTQAVLEGVAFGVRDMLEAAKRTGIKVERSMICGGGAKSMLWRRILANVLNMPLEVPECEEGPGFGGAILAMVACGVYKSVDEAVEKLIKVKDECVPDSVTASKYEQRYESFKKLYPALKEVFGKL